MSESLPYRLPAIPYVRLRMTLEAEEPARMPAFHGSMLRGAFGHALRRTVCVMGPEQACSCCMLRQACVYTRLFEPYIEGEPPPFLRGIDQAVRPYAFEPLGGEGPLEPGDALKFDLLLFGRGVELQAYALLAVERMARGGLGSGRAKFRLARVEAAEPGGSSREALRGGVSSFLCPRRTSGPTAHAVTRPSGCSGLPRPASLEGTGPPDRPAHLPRLGLQHVAAHPRASPTSTCPARRSIGASAIFSTVRIPFESRPWTFTGTIGNAGVSGNGPQ